MCKQFIVHLMNGSEVIEHRVNCNNTTSAQNIAESIFPKHRVIDIKEA